MWRLQSSDYRELVERVTQLEDALKEAVLESRAETRQLLRELMDDLADDFSGVHEHLDFVQAPASGSGSPIPSEADVQGDPDDQRAGESPLELDDGRYTDITSDFSDAPAGACGLDGLAVGNEDGFLSDDTLQLLDEKYTPRASRGSGSRQANSSHQ